MNISQYIQNLVNSIVDIEILKNKYQLSSMEEFLSIEDFQRVYEDFASLQEEDDEPVLKIIAGVPYSGKSHYVSLLIDSYPKAFVLQFDQIMMKFERYKILLETKSKEAAFHEYELPARWIGYQLLIRALERNVSILWEHSSTPEEHVDMYDYIWNETKYHVEMFHIDTPMDVIMKRTNKIRDGGRHLPIERIAERSEKLNSLIPEYKKRIPYTRIVKTL
jgi:hypothetical protein